MPGVVVIGGGQAAGQLCTSLIRGEYAEQITLISQESFIPYHRPPLSKDVVLAGSTPRYLADQIVYDRASVKLRLDTLAVRIDRVEKRVLIQTAENDNDQIDYERLVIATGARPRRLPMGLVETEKIFYLQNFTDAVRLHEACRRAKKILIIGGGFIGLELGALLVTSGKSVCILESNSRLLQRAVSPFISEEFLRLHAGLGVEIILNAHVQQIINRDQGLAVVTQEREFEGDIAIVSIGSTPNIDLACDAGLTCENGIEVDAHLCTTDPAISAIGDCTSFFYEPWQERIRLESVQNATAQAQILAAVLGGKVHRYVCRPWFWSDQASIRFQMTGLWRPSCRSEVVSAAKDQAFCVLHYENEQFVAVESINDMRRHLEFRKKLHST